MGILAEGNKACVNDKRRGWADSLIEGIGMSGFAEIGLCKVLIIVS